VILDLPALAAERTNRRSRTIEIRDIPPTKALAQELAAIYRPVLDRWADAAPRILQAYSATIDQLTRDTAADIDGELGSVGADIDRLVLILTARLRDWGIRVEKWHRDRWIANILSATGIDLGTVLSGSEVNETVDTVIRRNVALIRDVSAQARSRISDAVFRGVQQRRPAVDVARDIREAVQMGRRRSMLIASDQTAKLTSALDGERMRQAGIAKWKWRHSGKLHPRLWHRARDGKVYTWEDSPPADDMPGVPPYCGCRKQAVIDLD
jgi:SPP1 gp7 family putative phage head morphogenesis protein